MRESKIQPTPAYAKGTWASDVLLANQILPLIKPYRTPILPIPFNPKIGFSPTITTNYLYIKIKK
jgi:hypothetical protein